MSKSVSRRSMLGLGLGSTAFAATTLSAPAIAQSARVQWSMVTSWGKDAPGPGTTAQRLADRISQASDGELEINLYAAGERVGAFDVFDSVASGDVQMGHSASFFWTGKVGTAVAYFTTVPFGMTSEPYLGWLHYGGGQQLWDRLYSPFGVKPMMAGNSGMTMGGWFKEPIESVEDLAGLKIRAGGLGGSLYARLGASVVSLPPAQLYESLNSGAIDAVEFLGPFSDTSLGLYQAAENYYHPGFNKPNGPAEALFNMQAFDALAPHLQQIVTDACLAESTMGTAEAWANNAEKLSELSDLGVTLRQFPQEVMVAAKEAAEQVLFEAGREDRLAGEVYRSYRTFAEKSEALLDVTKASLLAR